MDYVWPDPAVVLAIHDEQIAEHGGASGLRDAGLLDAALHRPRHYLSSSKDADLASLAAALAHALAINHHPFVDGNKRAGFVVGVLFLELNRFAFRAAEAGATQAVLALAAGKMEEAAYTGWLRANSKQKRGR